MNVLILSEFQSLGFEGVLGYNKGGERGKKRWREKEQKVHLGYLSLVALAVLVSSLPSGRPVFFSPSTHTHTH
jgi:hypothetical protein